MQIYQNKPLSDTWLKAAVIGSLWASVEIIVGSFLHNLRVPMSGTLLTAFSVFLIIAFFQMWNDTGIIWRAGLVCALMKSLSPSAVIIGPMIGILSEAVIIWLFVLIFGKNLFSYILGGALAVASALLHKVASLLILYGFNLVRVADGLYQFALKQLHFGALDPKPLLFLILGLYLLLGSIAALMGYFSGKRQKSIKSPTRLSGKGKLAVTSELFSHTSKHSYSLVLLFAHVLAIILSLWLLNSSKYYIAVPLCLIYMAACFLWYKGSMGFLRKKAFWLQFVVITLIAAFLLEGYSTGHYFSSAGFMIGLTMNLRAFVILTGFAAISIELKNPLVRTVLYNRGFASLYQSLNLAFSALPDIIAELPKASEFIKKRSLFLSHLFSTSHELLARFKADPLKRPPVLIITGNVNQGKTSFLAEVIIKSRERGLVPGGILAPGSFKEEQKEGFWLEDVSTGKRWLLSSRTPSEGWKRYGHYYFNPETLQEGHKILIKAADAKADLIIIDEVGPLEMSNGGWAPSIERLCETTTAPQLWAVRSSLADKAARKWNVGDVYLFELAHDSIEDVMQTIEQIR
jgi:nucleoside-triphosphatase THEP1